jgi:hypothetical protein
MSDELKAKEEEAKPTGAPSDPVSPQLPTGTVQTNPNRNTAEDRQNYRRQKFHPILRLVRIIRKHRREFPKWTDIAIVILTGGIVFLAYMQHRDMADAGTQTDKIIASDERFAKAMEDSVAQAKRGLDASIETSRIDQRAWVGPTGNVSLNLKPNEQVKFRIFLTNRGKTPALHLHSDMTGKSILTKTPITFTYPPFAPDALISESAVQPGEQFLMDSVGNPILEQSQIDAIKRGEVTLYIYGKLLYQDIFGEKHHTTFCYVIDRNLTDAKHCHQYNYAD